MIAYVTSPTSPRSGAREADYDPAHAPRPRSMGQALLFPPVRPPVAVQRDPPRRRREELALRHPRRHGIDALLPRGGDQPDVGGVPPRTVRGRRRTPGTGRVVRRAVRRARAAGVARTGLIARRRLAAADLRPRDERSAKV